MIRCWQCGAEPAETVDVTGMGDTEPVSIPGRWPSGDHEHAVNPPTPGQLLEAGAQAFDRAMRAWLDEPTGTGWVTTTTIRG